jgi:hypothetical protein
MHIFNYTAVDITTFGKANLYVMLLRSSSYFRVLDRCPGFMILLVNIMACPSKKMRLSDEEVLCELLQENKGSDISESECSSDMK